MTNQTYMNNNQTSALKVGDKVVMHGCAEASIPKYKDKVWTCKTDSYIDKAGQEVVFLEDFSGCFMAKYLRKEVDNG